MTSKVEYSGELRTLLTHSKSGHEIITDAPIDNEGKGQAFSPTDLMATSLASCMLTVLGIRARDLGIDIKGSNALVNKIMSSSPRKVSRIEILLTIKGVKEKRIQSLYKQIATTCPVALSLSAEIEQKVEFVFLD